MGQTWGPLGPQQPGKGQRFPFFCQVHLLKLFYSENMKLQDRWKDFDDFCSLLSLVRLFN